MSAYRVMTEMARGYSPPSTSLDPRHVANPCRWCGAEVDIDWIDVTTLGGERTMIPGEIGCPTPGCHPRCPTCARGVGDIHGAQCGDIIRTKLGDLRPCTITAMDCGPRWQP